MISSFLIREIDQFFCSYPDSCIILCGDLNRLEISDISQNCNLVNIFNRPTYEDAQLDYILISETFSSNYTVSDYLPLDSSKTPHVSLVAEPTLVSLFSKGSLRSVYDLRLSNIRRFVYEISKTNWSSFYRYDCSVDEKTLMFDQTLCTAFDATIPVRYVFFSATDKTWMTPHIKSLIEKRWVLTVHAISHSTIS